MKLREGRLQELGREGESGWSDLKRLQWQRQCCVWTLPSLHQSVHSFRAWTSTTTTFTLPRNLGEILDYSPLLHILVPLILFSKYLLNHLLTLPTATTLVHSVHASLGLAHIIATSQLAFLNLISLQINALVFLIGFTVDWHINLRLEWFT